MSHDHAAQAGHDHCYPSGFRLIRPLGITLAVFAVFAAVSFLPPFTALNESLIAYIELIWWAVLLGLVIGGLIEYFVPEAFIFRFLGQSRKRVIPLAWAMNTWLPVS